MLDTLIWSFASLSLICLAFEDFKHYKVSLILLIIWMGFSGILNFPFSLNVLYNILILIIMYLLIKVFKIRDMGKGDWLFLLTMTPFFSIFDFMIFTVVSHLFGIFFILIKQVLNRCKPDEISNKKAPMISIYAMVFLSYNLYLWMN